MCITSQININKIEKDGAVHCFIFGKWILILLNVVEIHSIWFSPSILFNRVKERARGKICKRKENGEEKLVGYHELIEKAIYNEE